MGYEFNNDKVKSLLAIKNVKRVDASKHLNINVSTLRRKIKGSHEFTVKEIAELANLLKVDPGVFFNFSVKAN